MYSRNYQGETEEKLKLPANYDGTAFTEPKTDEIRDTGAPFSEGEDTTPAHSESVDVGAFGRDGGILSGMSRSLFGGLFDGGRLNLRLPKLGVEEILILATAAFLFFSKDGDTECAVLLLLLLLIN